jgi:hypothetical protein
MGRNTSQGQNGGENNTRNNAPSSPEAGKMSRGGERRAALERIIADGSLPDTDRAAAVFDMAGEVYFQARAREETDAQNADNERMDAEQTENFADKYWNIAYNHQKGGKIPHETVKIAGLTDLQQKAAVAAGLDFSGYSHTISANFIKHVFNSHSDANKEKSRGNNPVTARDISSDMPLILNFPDYIITGVVYKNEQRVIYGKTGNGTMFVLEHPQTGNKVLSAISFYKSRGIFSAKELIEQLRKDKRFDFSNAKVTDGTGGNPRSNGDLSHPAAATSAEPSDTSLSPSSAEKSSEKNAPDDPSVRILFQEGERNLVDEAAGRAANAIPSSIITGTACTKFRP